MSEPSPPLTEADYARAKADMPEKIAPAAARSPDASRSLASVVSVGLSWEVQCDGITLAVFVPSEKNNAEDFANGFNLGRGWSK